MTGTAGQTALSFLIALSLSLILMPLAVSVGAHLNLVVRPRLFRSSRSSRRISYLGGPAVCLATGAGVLMGAGLDRSTAILLGGAFGMLAITYPNNRRHRRRLHPGLVAALQVTVATVVWWQQFQSALPGVTGWLMTVFLLVGAANALNLLDNMNGVAGYTAAATAGGLVVIAFMGGTPEIGLTAAALCGASIGFVPYNHKRARVYLGAGAPEFMGFLLGAAALNGGLYFGPRWAPLAALAALAVPATDSALAILGRAATGRPLFAGDIDHISHRLFRMGFSTRRAARLHGLAALAATGSVAVALATGPRFLFIPIGIFAIIGIGLLAIEGREPVRARRGAPVLRYLFFGVVAIVGLSVPAAAAAAWDLQGAQRAFAEGKAYAASFNAAAARQAFVTGGERARSAEAKLSWPVTLPARALPVVGDNLRAAEALARSGALLGQAAEQALNAAELFPVGPAGPQIGFSEGRLNTEPWPLAAQELQTAAVSANLAMADVRAADGILLPPIKGAREAFLREGDASIRALEKAGDAAALLPHFFADGTRRTWFLALQNPVELRATGGFLGAFGILSAEDGKLTLERFAGNHELPPVSSPVAAPAEFARNYDKYYSRTYWTSTNMTPDFPTAAAVQAEMYEQGAGRRIDGVIAIDAVGLNRLLDVVGPVEVPDIGLVTSENFLSVALNEAYLRFPDKGDRTSFLLPVGREVWSRLVSGDFSHPGSLMVPLGDLVATKRIQIWSPDELERLERLGLAGQLRRPENGADYLMVVGQNAAGNKVDYYAQRRVSYQVDLTDRSSIAGLVEVEISNGVPEGPEAGYIMGPVLPNDPPGLNRTLTSVYLPMRTFVTQALINGSPSVAESFTELEHSVASKFLEIPPQTSSSFGVRTRSELETPGRYKLIVQHQPNLNPDQFELDITLPKGAFVYSYSPSLRLVGNHLRWSGVLDREMEFEVRYGSSYKDREDSVLAGG